VKADAQPINPIVASNEVNQFFRGVLDLFPAAQVAIDSQALVLTVDAGRPSQIQQRFVTTDELLRAFHILRC